MFGIGLESPLLDHKLCILPFPLHGVPGEAGMSGNNFLHFGTGMGKIKIKLSRSLGREREIQKTIPVVWDRNGKYKKNIPIV